MLLSTVYRTQGSNLETFCEKNRKYFMGRQIGQNIWGNTYAANLKCLVLLQKKVVRLIVGAQRLDYTSSLFYDLRILKLPDMVKLKTAEIIYKALNNSLPNNIQKLFVFV